MSTKNNFETLVYEDFYSNYHDTQNLLKFHYKSQLTFSKFYSMGVIYNQIKGENLETAEALFKETHISNALEEDIINLKKNKSASIVNRKSAGFFTKSQISTDELATFLYKSFGGRDGGQRRAYPSAGQLYPIEALLWIPPASVENLKPGIYHYLPISEKLIPLYISEGDFTFNNVMDGGLPLMGSPLFGIIYMMNVKRSVMKYRLRGYRNALIETGIMTQNADHVAHETGLQTRCWSSFDDRKLSVLSGLHPNKFAPTMLQWVGESVS
jgi:SagB-type dehydrogenase family enzyme